MVFSNIIISSFIGIAENEELNRNMLSRLPIYSVIAMVIVAPIIEESMTKIILKDYIKNKIVYSIITGLIFGSLHLLNITNIIEVLYIIPYGALGAALSYIYSESNNIWTNITFHAIHNFIAISLLFVSYILGV